MEAPTNIHYRCRYCKKAPATEGKRSCAKCREEATRRSESARIARLVDGICRICENRTATPGMKSCAQCRDGMKRQKAKYRDKLGSRMKLVRMLNGKNLNPTAVFLSRVTLLIGNKDIPDEHKIVQLQRMVEVYSCEQQEAPLEERTLSEIGVPVRFQQVLTEQGIFTAAQLAALGRPQLQTIRGLSSYAAKMCEEALGRVGLKFSA